MLTSEPSNHDLTFKKGSERLLRRVQGYHDLRLDGIGDLLSRARDASVFDIGCNRGMVGFEFACNGAFRVMGCDLYEDGIIAARHVFCDMRSVQHRFEVVDLTGGEKAIRKAFGEDEVHDHDIVLMLATYHKLQRVMSPDALSALVRYFGTKTKRYFAWRGEEAEMDRLNRDLGAVGLRKVQWSNLGSIDKQHSAIWAR